MEDDRPACSSDPVTTHHCITADSCDGQGAAALPTDIWKIVASHMNSADWARASGTSKATALVNSLKLLPET